LIQFHSEFIQSPYQKVLTCVLLPQAKEEQVSTLNNKNSLEHPATRRKSSFLIASIDKPLINFTCEESGENQERGLLRQPTPYPKDLKVHARHARNLVLKHLDLGNINLENADKSEEMSTSKTY